MKKNAIGHMNPEKKSIFSFFKRIHILPLLLCLLLAVILWLLVVNLNGNAANEPDSEGKSAAAYASIFNEL